ncbi:atypical/PIKK/PI4K protein kinase [Coprinopsis cinerea okayama7|uniref:1-phosphatidylinositol 4-kinase n=1 Tax=Coprinopsis cinerea (strain Okayama-7 / 130 / ATCC MYA-4618 / FGSC 9003) TaxID=240176 RepID=A8NFD2_COPC7|nr:atypical/PIKK/PI4K protein kinase [Coprinopsis cinerea okayama7\|eukprot:XP_001833255.2 atypical/PIKK/PI4K protein kinase [Coprinopsis cinerea okayama7\
MQAALNDLSVQRRNTQSFAVCQRVLHKCHEIIFSDLSPAPSGPYSISNLSPLLRRHKIKHHAEPVIVGIGTMLAGAPGMPRLTAIMGDVAIEQGRAEEDFDDRTAVGPRSEDDLAPPAVSARTSLDEDDDDQEGSPSSEESLPAKPTLPSNSALLARRKTVTGAQTVPTLPLHLRSLRKPRLSDDPLGQLETDSFNTPSHSSPSLTSALMSGRPLRSAMMNPADILLERYDHEAQTQLLRNHFCMSEVSLAFTLPLLRLTDNKVQFLLSLENICNRLLVVPRPARVSALRAELTALNHKLPAEVCLPLWCPGTDTAHTNPSHPHHRIVRIPPGESVVLNSAERAPYLLLVEILTDDLDFEPAKKSNKDVLRRIVLKDQERTERRGFSVDSPSFVPSPSRLGRPSGDVELMYRSELSQEPQTAVSVIPATPTTAIPPDPDEEVDLVEQLYGADQPLKFKLEELVSDSMNLPPTPKNKDLDLATWSRSSPMGSFSSSFGSPHSRQPSQTRVSMERTHSSPTPSTPASVDYSGNALSLDEYSERMRTAAIMLAQLNSGIMRSDAPVTASPRPDANDSNPAARMKVHHAETAAIRDRIMKEMISLEEERMARMQEGDGAFVTVPQMSETSGSSKTLEDESIIRKELNKVDPSAVVFSESWAAKKSRIRQSSPYGHLASLAQWDCMSVIVKTGGDLRQEQLAVQLIREFQSIWAEEKCACWVKHFRILITGSTSGLIETIKDAVSIHSIKKAEYAKRIAEGRLGHVTLLDHFKANYGDPSSSRFLRAQRNFAQSLAGYSIVTYLLQVKDRHNGNILLDRDGHLIHIDFGFILSNTPGNIGFEAAPFKFPLEYLEVLGGIDGAGYKEFKRLFREGFEAARKHCDRIITLVELMQKDSSYPCFAVSADQTANQLRDRFMPTLTHSLVGEHVERLIASSLGSHWTRLYDSVRVLKITWCPTSLTGTLASSNTTHNPSYNDYSYIPHGQA